MGVGIREIYAKRKKKFFFLNLACWFGGNMIWIREENREIQHHSWWGYKRNCYARLNVTNCGPYVVNIKPLTERQIVPKLDWNHGRIGMIRATKHYLQKRWSQEGFPVSARRHRIDRRRSERTWRINIIILLYYYIGRNRTQSRSFSEFTEVPICPETRRIATKTAKQKNWADFWNGWRIIILY